MYIPTFYLSLPLYYVLCIFLDRITICVIVPFCYYFVTMYNGINAAEEPLLFPVLFIIFHYPLLSYIIFS